MSNESTRVEQITTTRSYSEGGRRSYENKLVGVSFILCIDFFRNRASETLFLPINYMLTVAGIAANLVCDVEFFFFRTKMKNFDCSCDK